jgi:hypothetical protein
MKQKGINAWKFNFKKFPKDEKLRTTNKKASKRTEEKKNCLRKINGKTHQFSYFAFSPESRQSIRQGNQEAKIKKAVIKAMNFMGRTHKKSLFFLSSSCISIPCFTALNLIYCIKTNIKTLLDIKTEK